LRFFESYKQMTCDVWVPGLTYVMKLDATINLYHHMCDFFNIYLSQQLAAASFLGHQEAFSTDSNVLIWDNKEYKSNFGEVFKAFTKKDLLNLNSWGKSRVCFEKVVFSIPPRMIFGLFYNTPIVEGCSNSSLFQAFSDHMAHRLELDEGQNETADHIRVLLLSRNTRHRRILNQGEIVRALEKTGRYEVQIGDFKHNLDFGRQMRLVRGADVLVGVHGAGLTHMLWLPKWASVFEVYHCQDPACYSDLARLRGLSYTTWSDLALLRMQISEEDRKEHIAYAKFADYEFDVNEFVRKVDEAREKVLSSKHFPHERRRKILKDEL